MPTFAIFSVSILISRISIANHAALYPSRAPVVKQRSRQTETYAGNGEKRMANKYVTDEARKQIGKTSEPRTYDVERGAIRRFAEAIEDRNPLFNSERDARQTRFGSMIAPPTFCRSMGAPIPDIKLDMPTFRGLDGGSDWEYFVPIRPGDRITVQSKLVDLREAAGRLGPMVFTVVETTYTNQFGEVCVLQRSTGIRY